MSPKRIRLSRAKGWRKPEGAIVVTRPTKWGNPLTLDRPLDIFHVIRFAGSRGSRTMKEWRRDACAAAYDFVMTADRARMRRRSIAKLSPVEREMILHMGTLPTLEDIRAELAGRDLACWCPLDAPCHADTLLRLANGP